MREILKVRDLQFGYVSNDLVIDGLSFSLEAGEVGRTAAVRRR